MCFAKLFELLRTKPSVVTPVDNTAFETCQAALVDCMTAKESYQGQVADMQTIYDSLQADYDGAQKIVVDLKTQNYNLSVDIVNFKDTVANQKYQLDATKSAPEIVTLIQGLTDSANTLPIPVRSQLWWQSNQALFELFGVKDLKPFKIFTPQELKASVDKYYNGMDPLHPMLQWPEFADNAYTVPTVADTLRIFQQSFIGLIQFLAEVMDCDKFSAAFRSHLDQFYKVNSCATIYGDSGWGYHSYNLVVCSDGVVMIEPQASGKGADPIEYYYKVLPDIIGEKDFYWIARKIRDI